MNRTSLFCGAPPQRSHAPLNIHINVFDGQVSECFFAAARSQPLENP
jgi:hypothetical protein